MTSVEDQLMNFVIYVSTVVEFRVWIIEKPRRKVKGVSNSDFLGECYI